MSILKGLDRAAVSAAARLETRNREVVLPPVSIYRWWARRTVAVNEAILKTAEGAFVRTDGVLSVLDPFSGGGAYGGPVETL